MYLNNAACGWQLHANFSGPPALAALQPSGILLTFTSLSIEPQADYGLWPSTPTLS